VFDQLLPGKTELLIKYFQAAEIWLRYAECLFLLNRMEDSADAYSKVIQLAPGHKIARLNLSVILQKLGKYDTALESLDQSTSAVYIGSDNGNVIL
jgi:tetratricopeptide (TPR) repeat protein